jgi:hypothetical protein
MPDTATNPQYSSIQFNNPQRETVRKVFYQGCPGTSDTLLYTSPNLPGARSEILQLIVTNTDSSARTLWLHMVPKGGSNAVSNALFYEVSFAAHTTTIHDSLRLVMEEGYMLRGSQVASNKLCLTITGLVEIRRGGLS